jgi:hypothetical protein
MYLESEIFVKKLAGKLQEPAGGPLHVVQDINPKSLNLKPSLSIIASMHTSQLTSII